MTHVSIRDLRNKGGDIVERAARGEEITITRAGKPVAELRPVRRRPLSGDALLAGWRNLKGVDLNELRRDMDRVIDPSL